MNTDDYSTPSSDPLNILGTAQTPSRQQQPAVSMTSSMMEATSAPQNDTFTSAEPQSQLTQSTFVAMPSNDPVKSFLRDKTGVEHKVMKMEEVPMSPDGLRTLAENDCWKETMKMCEKLIQAGSYPPHVVVQFRLAFVVSLLRLRYYEPATGIIYFFHCIHHYTRIFG